MIVKRYTTSMEFVMNVTFKTTEEELESVYNISKENIKKLIDTGKIVESRPWGMNGTNIITELIEY